jgi:hypothetical protein
MMLLTMLAALAVFILLAFFRATVISWVLAVMVIVPVVAIQARLSETVLQLVYFLRSFFAPHDRQQRGSQAVPKNSAADFRNRAGSH